MATMTRWYLDAVGAGDDVAGAFSGGRGNSWDGQHQVGQRQRRALQTHVHVGLQALAHAQPGSETYSSLRVR